MTPPATTLAAFQDFRFSGFQALTAPEGPRGTLESNLHDSPRPHLVPQGEDRRHVVSLDHVIHLLTIGIA